MEEERVDGEVRERTIPDQKAIEWEVRQIYWKLYRKQEGVIDKEEIKTMTGSIKKISQLEKNRLDEKITIKEVSTCLKNTRNNVAPGCRGFSGAFFNVFWCYIKNVVLDVIHQIYEEKTLPGTLRFGVIALIPKGSQDKKIYCQLAPINFA